MNLASVMDELAARLRTIDGLRVTDYPPGSVSAPAGFPSYPEAIEYDATYGRGMDRIRALPVVIVFGRTTERTTRARVAEWSEGTGAASVKAILEAGQYTTFDVIHVSECTFAEYEIGGVPYLAAMFACDIAGGGS